MEEVGSWFEALRESFVISERDESLETGVHHTAVSGNTITILSERVDGSYFLDSVTVDL